MGDGSGDSVRLHIIFVVFTHGSNGSSRSDRQQAERGHVLDSPPPSRCQVSFTRAVISFISRARLNYGYNSMYERVRSLCVCVTQRRESRSYAF